MTTPRQALGGAGVDESAVRVEEPKKIREDGLPEYEGDDDEDNESIDIDNLDDMDDDLDDASAP